MPVHIGDNVMIGQNTLISTVNHPLTPMGRSKHVGIQQLYKYKSEKDDAREVAGYARLSVIYEKLGFDEDKALPIKCLIVYPESVTRYILYI